MIRIYVCTVRTVGPLFTGRFHEEIFYRLVQLLVVCDHSALKPSFLGFT